jgi:hypothetical protein
MEADLAALRAEIRRNNAFLAIVLCSIPVLAVVFGVMLARAAGIGP